MSDCPKVGDRVRFSAWDKTGTHEGVVLRVTPMVRPVGGARHRVRVRWDTGVIGTYEDRVLEVLP